MRLLNRAKANQPAKETLAPEEQPLILEKPIFWSRAFVWLIIAMAVGSVTWACLAQVDEAVPATGKLEPDGAVKDVQAPASGVIRGVKIKEGQEVKEGDLLFTLDPTAPEADREALLKAQAALQAENAFLMAQLEGTDAPDAENSEAAKDFLANQKMLLQASRSEFTSRAAAARLEVQQLRTQLAQTQEQLAKAQNVLEANRGILERSKEIRDTNEQILADMKPVAESGALSRLQYRQQEQRLQSAQSDVLNREAQIASAEAEIARLEKEEERLNAAIAQAEERLSNTISVTHKDLLQKISDNKKRLAEIDSQLRKAELLVSYQEIRSPVSGKVFNLKAYEGYVISGATTTQPLTTIVPNNTKLVAKVFITNRDIGFVRTGLPVEVKVDSFPALEFGTLKGKLTKIGGDALPPTQERPYYAFPATIELDSQTFNLGGGKVVPLQAGMSVNSSILLRKRSVMTIFLSQFTSKVDSLKYTR